MREMLLIPIHQQYKINEMKLQKVEASVISIYKEKYCLDFRYCPPYKSNKTKTAKSNNKNKVKKNNNITIKMEIEEDLEVIVKKEQSHEVESVVAPATLLVNVDTPILHIMTRSQAILGLECLNTSDSGVGIGSEIGKSGTNNCNSNNTSNLNNTMQLQPLPVNFYPKPLADSIKCDEYTWYTNIIYKQVPKVQKHLIEMYTRDNNNNNNNNNNKTNHSSTHSNSNWREVMMMVKELVSIFPIICDDYMIPIDIDMDSESETGTGTAVGFATDSVSGMHGIETDSSSKSNIQEQHSNSINLVISYLFNFFHFVHFIIFDAYLNN